MAAILPRSADVIVAQGMHQSFLVHDFRFFGEKLLTTTSRLLSQRLLHPGRNQELPIWDLICTPTLAMSTPIKSTPTKPAPATDSPGTWRHPRLNEITRRQKATSFTEKNVRQIAYNVVTLLALWSVRLVAKLKINPQMYAKPSSHHEDPNM